MCHYGIRTLLWVEIDDIWHCIIEKLCVPYEFIGDVHHGSLHAVWDLCPGWDLYGNCVFYK